MVNQIQAFQEMNVQDINSLIAMLTIFATPGDEGCDRRAKWACWTPSGFPPSADFQRRSRSTSNGLYPYQVRSLTCTNSLEETTGNSLITTDHEQHVMDVLQQRKCVSSLHCIGLLWSGCFMNSTFWNSKFSKLLDFRERPAGLRSCCCLVWTNLPVVPRKMRPSR